MGSSQPQHHDPNRDPIEQFIDLVRGGTTIQLAADTVGIPHYLAYRTAHNHDLPFQRHRTPQHMRDHVAECWQAGWKPMDIARHTYARVATVYDIGVELGLWQRPPTRTHRSTYHPTLRIPPPTYQRLVPQRRHRSPRPTRKQRQRLRPRSHQNLPRPTSLHPRRAGCLPL